MRLVAAERPRVFGPCYRLGPSMLEEGTLIDAKYRIVRKIGEGGMGAVFEGEAVRIHRRVAIKVMLPGQDAEQLASRFRLEAQAAGRIGSNHIVEVIDLGALETGEQFMVMEYLEGESMRSRLTRVGRLPPPELIPIVLQLLEALHAAHAASIIHRDLKPDNVFLVKQPGGDFVKLLDFGVSKFNSGNANMSLTRTGSVLGTPYYMSPEQASGKPVDHRADLYAVGVILYEGLSGSVPFTADSFNELLFKIVLEQPVSLQERVPGIDPGLYAIVERSMARDPADRFQSAEQMRAALAAWVPAGLASLTQSGAMPRHVTPQSLPTPQIRSNPSIRPNTLGSWAKSRADGGEEPVRSFRWALVGVAATVGIAAAALFALSGTKGDSQSPASAGMPSSADEAKNPPPEITPTRSLPTITPSEPLTPPPQAVAPPSEPIKEDPEKAEEPRPKDRRAGSQAPSRNRVSRPAAAPIPTPRRVAELPPTVAATPPAPTQVAPAPPPPPPAPAAPKDDAARTPSGRYIRSDL